VEISRNPQRAESRKPIISKRYSLAKHMLRTFRRKNAGTDMSRGLLKRFINGVVAGAVAASLAIAQDAPQGWPRADGPAQNDAPTNMQPAPAQNAPAPADPVPSRLTIQTGTFVTVRVNQTLSSDRNQPGDAFSATLIRPLIVDGVVVAQRGQTLGGHVIEAKKAGRVEGTSRLAIQLTDLTLVDGQQVPIQSQFVSRAGGTSIGRDAGAIAGTTAMGAAIGSIADWGTGAAIGAGAGAAAGVIGVLLTRGRPTEIYPESVLTFRIVAPVTIATDRAPQVFHYADPADYDQPSDHQPPTYAQANPVPPCAGYGCAAPPPPPVYYYGPAYYPYYWGPSFYFYSGPRFYYGPRYYGPRGYYYRGYRR
jgi:hypothetical protein